MIINGVRFYLRDDCDTLLCKLQNIADDYYYNNNPCDIDKVEDAIDRLETAIDSNDIRTMQSIFNGFHVLFKRYA